MLEKLVSMLQPQGYEKENVQVAKEMVEIIRLRGLYDKPDRWLGTYNVIYKSWTAFHWCSRPWSSGLVPARRRTGCC